jgi:hypothetical protein
MNKIVFVVGLIFMLSCSTTFSYTFATAYFSESKTTLVDINSVGEANIELFLLIIGLISMFVCIPELRGHIREQ